VEKQWFEQEKWDDQIHREFYDRYNQSDPETQKKALLVQTKILAESRIGFQLKADESLLLLSLSLHYDKKEVKSVYELVIKICKRMGDLERAHQFESYLKDLRHL
jgi:hypothetical protein